VDLVELIGWRELVEPRAGRRHGRLADRARQGHAGDNQPGQQHEPAGGATADANQPHGYQRRQRARQDQSKPDVDDDG